MVDNVSITAGSGTAIAADDVAGVLYQRVKLALGADGVAADAPVGNGTAATALRVSVASDSTGVTKVTDGTNFMPTMDVAFRPGFMKVTDGTNTMPTGDTSARALFVKRAPLALVSSTALESGRVLKASAGNLHSLSVYIDGASARWIMVYNSTTVPADGATTPVLVWRVPSDGVSGWLNIPFNTPISFSTGISVACSSTGPLTKTASAVAYISGQID
jgi:hypothetical protein